MSEGEWINDGWWRVLGTAPGPTMKRLWCETSLEAEARAALKRCPYPARLERHVRRTEERWVKA